MAETAGFEVIDTLGVVQDTKKYLTKLEVIKFSKSGDMALLLNRTITGAEGIRNRSMILDAGTAYAVMNALEAYFRG